MGVLGKDLLDFHRPRTNTKVEFGASGYWVESNPAMQPYGAVLTEILNLDAAPLQESLDQYRKAVAERDAEQAAQAFQAVANGFASLPLYRLYWNDVQLFASMDVSELFVGDAQEAFCEYVMQDDTLPRFMQEQLDAIRLIQERYAWFLDGIFAGKPFEKKKGQRSFSLTLFLFKRLARKNAVQEPHIALLNQSDGVQLLLHEPRQRIILHCIFAERFLRFAHK